MSRLSWRALVVATALVGILAPSTAAHADPTADQVDKELAAAAQKLDSVVEAYNKINEELKASQAEADRLNAELVPLSAELDAARDRTDQIAAMAYEGGTLLEASALMASTDPQNLVGRLHSVAQLTLSQRDQISTAYQSKVNHDEHAGKLQAVIADETAKRQDLENQKQQISAEITKLQALRAKYARQPTAVSAAGPPPDVAGRAGLVVNFAYAQIGKPYAWAAAGPGSYDCSGLTMAAWAAAGVSLPHNAEMQWNAMPHLGRSSLQPGDLVFYSGLGHVAIFVGSGQVIHAPTFGDHVRLASVDMMAPYGYARPR